MIETVTATVTTTDIVTGEIETGATVIVDHLVTTVADDPHLHHAPLLVNAIVATTAPEATEMETIDVEAALETVNRKATIAGQALEKAMSNPQGSAHWQEDSWVKNWELASLAPL